MVMEWMHGRCTQERAGRGGWWAWREGMQLESVAHDRQAPADHVMNGGKWAQDACCSLGQTIKLQMKNSPRPSPHPNLPILTHGAPHLLEIKSATMMRDTAPRRPHQLVKMMSWVDKAAKGRVGMSMVTTHLASSAQAVALHMLILELSQN